jgi:dTDP-4-amino-4,6-dideoxygalactose transaminase
MGRVSPFPAGVCLNIPLSVHYAGATPVYCDIDPGTLGLSPATLSGAAGSFAAVLAVHAYGNVCDIEAIEDHCRLNGIPLIEDVAVAQGACAAGRPARSFGVASVLSFGRGKTIDVGGGGAVLTNDSALATEIRQAHAHLLDRTDADRQRLDTFSSWHTRLYNQNYGKDLDRHVASFVEHAMALCNATLTRYSWNRDKVAGGLEEPAENLMRRCVLTAQLFDMVEARLPGVRCHFPPRESAPWRANLFIPRHRDRVLRTLLSEGVRISSWYPPAQDFLAPAWSSDTPIARRDGEEILNVWANAEADAGYLDIVAGKIAALTGAATHQSPVL